MLINSSLIAARLKALLAEHSTFRSLADGLALHLDRVRSVDAAVATKLRELGEHEPFKLMGPEHHANVGKQFRDKWLPQRRLGAAVSRYNLEPQIPRLESQLRTAEKQLRRDVLRSYGDHMRQQIERSDPALLGLLSEQVRANRLPELRGAAPSTRLALYLDALASPDLTAPLLLGLIEKIADTATGATAPAELSAAQELRRAIRDAQDLRVPIELDDVRTTIDAAKQLITAAERLGIQPTRPDVDREAAAAFEAERRELANIGAAE